MCGEWVGLDEFLGALLTGHRRRGGDVLRVSFWLWDCESEELEVEFRVRYLEWACGMG